MNPYLGEIRIFAGTFAPVGWSFCNGALLKITDNPQLYSVIGTAYGGDGTTTFGLPNLLGRLNVGSGTGPGITPKTQGQSGGTESVTLTAATMPPHNHPLNTAGTDAVTGTAGPTVTFANTASPDVQYLNAGVTGATQQNPATGTIMQSSGGGAHINIMPGLALNYIICTNGIYPSN